MDGLTREVIGRAEEAGVSPAPSGTARVPGSNRIIRSHRGSHILSAGAGEIEYYDLILAGAPQ